MKFITVALLATNHNTEGNKIENIRRLNMTKLGLTVVYTC